MIEVSSTAQGEGASNVSGVLAQYIPSGLGYAELKSSFDVALAAILFVVTAPLFLLAALLVKLTSRGPVIYSQRRLGQYGRVFTIYKFRSMTHDCERETGPRWATARDPRVTPVGRFLRKTHLDELPQLWNVLRGDMSLVGPRPERPEIATQLEKALPGYAERLRVKPGVTGLAQVQLPPDTDLESVRVKLMYDRYYVEHVGLFFDLQLILATLPHALSLPHAVSRLLFGLPGQPAIEAYLGEPSAVGGEGPADEPAVVPASLEVRCPVDGCEIPHALGDMSVVQV